jgi:hypothetical protein
VTGDGRPLAARMRAGRLDQVAKQIEVIAAAVDGLREVVARLTEAEQHEQPPSA